MCWIYSVLRGCFCIRVTVSGIYTCELYLQNLQFLENFKPQQCGNFPKYELSLINLVSYKRPLEVGIIDILNFSLDICCHGACNIGFV